MFDFPLISLEGIDGVGKTTVMKTVLGDLQAHYDTPFNWVFYPGQTVVGQGIRQLLFGNPLTHNMHEHTKQLLFCTDIFNTAQEIILPTLSSGHGVLVDRYLPSTRAYGLASGITYNQLEHIITTAFFPHQFDTNAYLATQLYTYHILLDMDVKDALDRKTQKEHGDTFALDFYTTVQNNYHSMVTEKRWRVIDAALPPERVHGLTLEACIFFIDAHQETKREREAHRTK